jgi:hypothetical protein
VSERYAPDRAFPPYAFVAPHRPHPRKDPRGHSSGAPEMPAEPLDPADWRRSPEYLFGIDLFNHGYYWEAHEAWEALWHAAGRTGPVADLLRGLIKLAAAGVKVRQREPRGIRSHGERAAGHFRSVISESGARRLAGLDLEALARFADGLAARAESLRGDPTKEVEVVFDAPLRPE